MNVLEELSLFYKNFKKEKGYMGVTERGKLIPFFKIYKTERPKIIIVYAIHAREYITTYLALKQIKDYIKNSQKGTVYFIPALNLDGIEICLTKNPLYKANALGVDLNVNFDAKWGTGLFNKTKKGAENFIGEYPFSAIETKSLRDFTLFVNPDITVSYHSKGEEIYFDFFQEKCRYNRDKNLAQKLAKATGYKIKENLPSSGGYKDWCVDKLKIPSFTIEVGNDNLSHPIKKDKLKDIYLQNKNVIDVLTENYNG